MHFVSRFFFCEHPNQQSKVCETMATYSELGAIIVFGLSIFGIIVYNFKWWHIVQEGNVGFYYRFGLVNIYMTFNINIK